MSLYFVNTEYDIELAVGECAKLITIGKTRVKLAFQNKTMLQIFLNDLSRKCKTMKIDPLKSEFHMDILIEESFTEES